MQGGDMAHKPEPHPETDPNGETIEFAAIKPEQELVWHEVSDQSAVIISGLCEYPVEVRIGQTTETSSLFIERGREYAALCEAEGIDPSTAYVLVQPDVMAENPRAGWLVISPNKEVNIGRAETPQFRLGGDIARKQHMTIKNKGGSQEELSITAYSLNPTKVRVRSDFAFSDRKFVW